LIAQKKKGPQRSPFEVLIRNVLEIQ